MLEFCCDAVMVQPTELKNMQNNLEATGFTALTADIGGTTVRCRAVKFISVEEPGLIGAAAWLDHSISARLRIRQ